MSWLDDLQNIIQKPQSVLMGGLMGTLRAGGFLDKESQYHQSAQNPLTGLLEGWKGEISPHDLLNEGAGTSGQPNFARQAMNTIADVTVDPLMLVGPIAKSGALGAKAAKGADLALSAGKIDDAKLATHVARGLRRIYQGSLATGDITSGISAGLLQGVTENSLAKWGPGVIAKIMSRSPELSDEAGGAVKSAIQVARNDLDDLLPDSLDPRAALKATRAPTLSPLESALQANPATSRDLSTVLRPEGQHFSGGSHVLSETGPVEPSLRENDLEDVFAQALGTPTKKILMDPMIQNQDDVAAQLLALLQQGR